MKILILGGTGFIGKKLIEQLSSNHHDILLLTRNKKNISQKLENHRVQLIEWDGKKIPLINDQVVDAVINLAGESIASGRWTIERKREILESRIYATKAIIQAIEDKNILPKILINASAIGFYGTSENEVFTEASSKGNDFLADVSSAWEDEARKAEQYGVRTVVIRIGVVLGKGGALAKMLLPYHFYSGGSIGSGRQWVSWIHITDLVRIFDFTLNNSTINGPVNGTAPNPVTMKQFHYILGKALNKPSWFNVPEFMLRLILGEMAEMLTKGQKVIPENLTRNEFEFQYKELETALRDIVN